MVAWVFVGFSLVIWIAMGALGYWLGRRSGAAASRRVPPLALFSVAAVLAVLVGVYLLGDTLHEALGSAISVAFVGFGLELAARRGPGVTAGE